MRQLLSCEGRNSSRQAVPPVGTNLLAFVDVIDALPPHTVSQAFLEYLRMEVGVHGLSAQGENTRHACVDNPAWTSHCFNCTCALYAEPRTGGGAAEGGAAAGVDEGCNLWCCCCG